MIKFLKSIWRKIPNLSLQPFTLKKKMIDECCKIKTGKNKGKYDLKKYAELLYKAGEVNQEMADKYKPW